MKVFNHNFAIDCSGGLNDMVFCAEAIISNQTGPVRSQVLIHVNIFQGFIFLAFNFDFGLKTRSLLSQVANFTKFLCVCLVTVVPTWCDTTVSSVWTG